MFVTYISILDQQPLAEIKALFQGFSVDIYYVFYEEFNALISASKSKGTVLYCITHSINYFFSSNKYL